MSGQRHFPTPYDYNRGIRCANGHRHDSIAEVRACFGVGASVARAVTQAAPPVPPRPPVRPATVPVQAPVASVPAPVTPVTPDPIAATCGRCGGVPHKSKIEDDACLSITETWLKAQAQRGVEPDTRQLADEYKPEKPNYINELLVPKGNYAVPHKGQLRFFKVKENKPGYNKPAWLRKYRRVVQMSSDNEIFIRNVDEKQEILRNILAMGVEFSMKMYGIEIGSCGRCGRTLTDEDSRARGIGPDCWEIMGHSL